MRGDAVAVGYFDTSVLVKSYVDEPGTPRALAMRRQHPVVCSAVATVELSSAFRRHRDQGALTAVELESLLARVRDDRLHWRLLAVDPVVLTRAERVAQRMPVRTLDAIHVASAVVFREETGIRAPFITADERQQQAGLALGLDVVFVG